MLNQEDCSFVTEDVHKCNFKKEYDELIEYIFKNSKDGPNKENNSNVSPHSDVLRRTRNSFNSSDEIPIASASNGDSFSSDSGPRYYDVLKFNTELTPSEEQIYYGKVLNQSERYLNMNSTPCRVLLKKYKGVYDSNETVDSEFRRVGQTQSLPNLFKENNDVENNHIKLTMNPLLTRRVQQYRDLTLSDDGIVDDYSNTASIKPVKQMMSPRLGAFYVNRYSTTEDSYSRDFSGELCPVEFSGENIMKPLVYYMSSNVGNIVWTVNKKPGECRLKTDIILSKKLFSCNNESLSQVIGSDLVLNYVDVFNDEEFNVIRHGEVCERQQSPRTRILKALNNLILMNESKYVFVTNPNDSFKIEDIYCNEDINHFFHNLDLTSNQTEPSPSTKTFETEKSSKTYEVPHVDGFNRNDQELPGKRISIGSNGRKPSMNTIVNGTPTKRGEKAKSPKIRHKETPRDEILEPEPYVSKYRPLRREPTFQVLPTHSERSMWDYSETSSSSSSTYSSFSRDMGDGFKTTLDLDKLPGRRANSSPISPLFSDKLTKKSQSERNLKSKSKTDKKSTRWRGGKNALNIVSPRSIFHGK